MADIRACLTSRNEHYCSPPEITVRTRRLLCPQGSKRTLIDPATNGASVLPAEFICDGIESDGLHADWSEADGFYNNCPYGSRILDWAKAQARWGKVMPGVALLPARVDTQWAQEYTLATADAWVFVRGRLTFWVPIPLGKRDAAPVESGEPYYLRRWYPWAEDDNLPAPFRSKSPGFAVGPELGSNGKPQSAPFPSLVAFWGHPGHDAVAAREAALVELGRSAYAHLKGDDLVSPACTRSWRHRAIDLIGDDKLTGDATLGSCAWLNPPKPVYPDVRDFARHFLSLGTLTIPRGPHAGVYRK